MDLLELMSTRRWDLHSRILDIFTGQASVYDLQAVPHSDGMYIFLQEIIRNHQSQNGKVVVVNAFTEFPGQEESFMINSVTELILFLRNCIKAGTNEKTIYILNGFHDLLELYKLQLSATHQKVMLKIHATNNAEILKHSDQYEAEGSFTPSLQEIPKNSGLLKESPSLKYTTHMNYLLNLLSQLVHDCNAMVFLASNLDVKFKAYNNPTMSLMSSQSRSQTRSQSRSSQSQTSTRLAFEFANTNTVYNRNVLDSVISKRIMFYRDWLYSGKLVYVARVEGEEPVYFERDMTKVEREVREERILPVSTETTLLQIPSSPVPAPLAVSTQAQMRHQVPDVSSASVPPLGPATVPPGSDPAALVLDPTDTSVAPAVVAVSGVSAPASQSDDSSGQETGTTTTQPLSTQTQSGHLKKFLDKSLVILDSQDMGSPLFL